MRPQTRHDGERTDAAYRFFGGKGGVGKTTCAAAFALDCAHRGELVLIASTDPAHSLGDALGLPLSRGAREVRAGKGKLVAVELDARRALKRWLAGRKRTLAAIAERGTYLGRADVDQLLELTMPGVDELIGLIEIERLAAARRYARVVIDAAPTGHLLRLLQMPAVLAQLAAVFDRMQEKHRFLSLSLTNRYQPDRSDSVIEDLGDTARRLTELLGDDRRCRFSWVTLAEPMSLAETSDAIEALVAAGIRVDQIIVNRVLNDPRCGCAMCRERRASEAALLARIRGRFRDTPLTVLEEQEGAPVGVRALLTVGHALSRRTAPRARRASPAVRESRAIPARRHTAAPPWLETLAPPERRLILFGGKGGVGKTTCATTVALWLARQAPERRILLLSTDPAHSLGDCLGLPVGDTETAIRGASRNLRVRELDASRSFADQRDRHRLAVDQLFRRATSHAGVELAFDREIVRELFAIVPPGIDELVAMLAITDALLPGKSGRPPPHDLVVVDTAPTGHAVRLLEMPDVALQWVHALIGILLEYRRAFGLGELAASLVEQAAELKQLRDLLRHPDRTSFVAVMRAERLVRLETARLARRLRALKIPLGAVLMNAAAQPGCRQGRSREHEVATPAFAGAHHCAMIVAPAAAPPPRGPRALMAWGGTWKIGNA